MEITLNLDDDLMAEAFRLHGSEDAQGLIHEALRMFVATRRRRPRRSLFDLEGKIEFAPGYDYKTFR